MENNNDDFKVCVNCGEKNALGDCCPNCASFDCDICGNEIDFDGDVYCEVTDRRMCEECAPRSEMTFKKKVCQIDIAHDNGVQYGMHLIRRVFDNIEDDVAPAALAGAMSYIAFSMGANSTNPEESEKALFKMFQFSEIKFHEGVEAMEHYRNGRIAEGIKKCPLRMDQHI